MTLILLAVMSATACGLWKNRNNAWRMGGVEALMLVWGGAFLSVVSFGLLCLGLDTIGLL